MNVAFFAFETRNLNTYPSIVNAARLLSKEGHCVDIYLPSSMSTDVCIDNVRIFVVSGSEQYEYVTHSSRLARNLGCPYDLFFAFYIEGLIVSEILSNNNNVPVPIIYFSMELIYKNYPYRLISNILNPNKQLAGFVSSIIWAIKNNILNTLTVRRLLSASFKQIAYSILALRSWSRFKDRDGSNILFSIVSDHMREMALKEELPFVDRVVYTPEAGYIGYQDEKSDYAVNKFGISPNKKILLYTGGLEKGFDLSLLDVSKNLGDDYILFFNVYSRDEYVQEIITEYSNEIKSGRLFIQTSNLNENDFDELVRSAHIGVVWYPPPSPENPNMFYLGLSSGKLNKFLSCGKPVVCSDGIYGYREMIEGNGLGRICKNGGEIPSAVAEIGERYQADKQNIRLFYLKNIEFELCFQRVLKEINTSMPSY